ncbi:MAG: tRNA (adenosine(37)-N6)-threonylcarbamoyltransferase complex dimerization subunit type 1 TsaB [Candidatus Omnitrophica bacterium]|nr:tRNA (adenosine(37)-N6)-threonylcarbamoyltransferase complex dimerization subunit type 1 TsaB [Candidatus Omnitrophota bacterium]MBU1924809.1 tRNA (adenosine(37)-N6)-threonylcarbamoyltransferase complex dimerization subunit type 1 TsaB [Candidatus Omnitrophota bacterium]
MVFLGIDTSTKFLCAVLARQGKVIAVCRKEREKAHAQLLPDEIGRLLKRARIRINDIRFLGVDIGPGSFTGIRIGIALVKGLGLALGVKIAGVPSLDILAWGLKNKTSGLICPVIDAKRGQVYAALYENRSGNPVRITGYYLGKLGGFLKKIARYKKDIVFTGDGAGLYEQDLKRLITRKFTLAKADFWFPNAQALAQACLNRCQAGKAERADFVSALYLYPDTCTVQSKKKRVKA